MKMKPLFTLAVAAMVMAICLSLKTPTGKLQNGPEPGVKRGEKIVMSFCVLCHGADDGKLSGKYMSDIPEFIGKVYPPNITQDMENGIGKYTREQLRILLRTRVKPNGQKALAVMPGFPLMADEDIEAIIDFLKSDHVSVQPSSVKQPPHEVKFMLRYFDKKFDTFPMPAAPIPMPDPNDKVAVGGYYVNAVFRCYECHSSDMIPLDQNPTSSKKYLAGGNTMYDLEKKKVKVKNITPDKETGIGNWTEDDFYKIMNTGMRKNGKMSRFPMAPLPLLTREDVNSIYAYLMAQKPIKNKVKE